MFKRGDRVLYFCHNQDRWVKATITNHDEKEDEITYGCHVDESEMTDQPEWASRNRWGYEDQFKSAV